MDQLTFGGTGLIMKTGMVLENQSFGWVNDLSLNNSMF